MESRSPVEGYFGVNFSRSVIVAELWRPEVARLKKWEILRFLEYDP